MINLKVKAISYQNIYITVIRYNIIIDMLCIYNNIHIIIIYKNRKR